MTKKATKKSRGRPSIPDDEKARLPSVRISPEQLASYTQSATKAKKTFSDWVRAALDKAAGRK